MSSKQNKKSAREQLAEERRKQAEAAQRKQRMLNIGIAVVVIVLVVGIFAAVQASRNSGPAEASLPATVTEQGGGAAFGAGPVTVNLWEDFQCPACKTFEDVHGETLRQLALDDEITFVIHPLSFLDQNLNNSSSKLAANAFGCSLGTDRALDFHLKVFENQPAENLGQEAWSAADLIGWGNQVGIEGSEWESCVNDQRYAGWVTQVAASQIDAGITSTPTLLVDGQRVELSSIPDAKALEARIAAAAKD